MLRAAARRVAGRFAGRGARRHFGSAAATPVQATAFDAANIRNVAIIAHVDHGKTTLVDGLLSQGMDAAGVKTGAERVMDSNTLEQERGITILSKCTSVVWPGREGSEEPPLQLNIVDTPGHSDFGGEVERVLSMVDGVLLVVDGTDGPMTQTKFVLGKALQRSLPALVVVNKVDRPTARLGEVENEVLDLFASFDGVDEALLDYPVLYAVARDGWATASDEAAMEKQMAEMDGPAAVAALPATDDLGGDFSMRCIVDAIRKHIPAPSVNLDAPFRMLVTQLDRDDFVGKLLQGRVTEGSVSVGDTLDALDADGNVVEAGVRVTKLFGRRGLDLVVLDSARAGDIVMLAGFDASTVNTTVVAPGVTEPLPSTPIDPPTLSMVFSTNDSPLMGQDANVTDRTLLTSDAVRKRLLEEAVTNVSLQVQRVGDDMEVSGRGELQIAVLVETMRRDGYELSVSPPRVIMREDEKGNVLEPLEEVVCDVLQEDAGPLIEKVQQRKGTMMEYEQDKHGDGRVRLVFHVPTRGLIGLRSEFVNDTRGSGIMNSAFHSYVPKVGGDIKKSNKGALIATEPGSCTFHALDALQSRGTLFVSPGDEVYMGMVVGENSRETDVPMNVVKAKQLSNVRSTSSTFKEKLVPPVRRTLEEMIAYCRDDEMIEVTASHIRLRKRYLKESDRKRLKNKDKKEKKGK